MAQKIIITVGISGCGKSTIAAALVEQKGFKEANLDEYRKKLSGDISNQKVTKDAVRAMNKDIRLHIKNGHNVIISNTNLDENIIKNYIETYENCLFRIIIFEDSYNWKLCYKRIDEDLKSGKDRSRVPPSVVLRQHIKFKSLVDKLFELEDYNVKVSFI